MSTKPAGPAAMPKRCPASPWCARARRSIPPPIDYIFVWKPKPNAFDGLANLKAVLSLGAGVDALLKHPGLPDAPIVRFVDADLTQRMTDYVVAQVTMHQRLVHALQARPGGAALDAALSARRVGDDCRRDGPGRARHRCGREAQGARLHRARLEPFAQDDRRRRAPSPGDELDAFLGRDRHPRLPAAADAGHHGHPQLRRCSRNCAASSMAAR